MPLGTKRVWIYGEADGKTQISATEVSGLNANVNICFQRLGVAHKSSLLTIGQLLFMIMYILIGNTWPSWVIYYVYKYRYISIANIFQETSPHERNISTPSFPPKLFFLNNIQAHAYIYV